MALEQSEVASGQGPVSDSYGGALPFGLQHLNRAMNALGTLWILGLMVLINFDVFGRNLHIIGHDGHLRLRLRLRLHLHLHLHHGRLHHGRLRLHLRLRMHHVGYRAHTDIMSKHEVNGRRK